MVRRKGELSKAAIDRDWPHQVALAAEVVACANFVAINDVCREEKLSLFPRGHSNAGQGGGFVCYCFAERAHAERFQRRFGGEFADPATRPRWPGQVRCIDPAPRRVCAMGAARIAIELASGRHPPRYSQSGP
jgi:hypothetical protein